MGKIELNRTIAQKVLKTVDAGLVSGLGIQKEGKMCVEAAVCFALGLPHGDNPPCVGDAVRRFKIRLNDARWPTNEDRTKGMRKLAIAQLGSNEIDQREFADRIVLKTIQRVVPLSIRFAIKMNAKISIEWKDKLEAVASECEKSSTNAEAKAAINKGKTTTNEYRKYAYAADAYAADAAADAAAAAASAAASAASSADASSAAASSAAAAASAASSAVKIFRIQVLNLSAEIGLEVLIELKSPGCKWLDLCE